MNYQKLVSERRAGILKFQKLGYGSVDETGASVDETKQNKKGDKNG